MSLSTAGWRRAVFNCTSLYFRYFEPVSSPYLPPTCGIYYIITHFLCCLNVRIACFRKVLMSTGGGVEAHDAVGIYMHCRNDCGGYEVPRLGSTSALRWYRLWSSNSQLRAFYRPTRVWYDWGEGSLIQIRILESLPLHSFPTANKTGTKPPLSRIELLEM